MYTMKFDDGTMTDYVNPKMKLYWYPMYRSFRNIKEMGVEDDFELIKYKPNSDPPVDAVYRKDVHPHGTIPALVVPGRSPLLESGAICLYLDDKYGKLVPDVNDRADYYDFIVYANVTLDEIFEFYYFYWTAKTEVDEEKEKKNMTKVNTALDYLTQRLQGRDFICGKTFTAADCVIGFELYYGSLFNDGELLQNHSKVRKYIARLVTRPSFQSTLSMT